MSVVEDSRKVLQDFLAPELRAISVRLDALEKRVEGVDKKFDEVERRAEKRHDEVMSAIARIGELSLIRERLARLESSTSTHQ